MMWNRCEFRDPRALEVVAIDRPASLGLPGLPAIDPVGCAGIFYEIVGHHCSPPAVVNSRTTISATIAFFPTIILYNTMSYKWRWRESNPRPEARSRNLYRFIRALKLSGKLVTRPTAFRL